MDLRKLLPVLAVLGALLAGEAHASQYVLRSPGFTARKAALLAAAGGKVKYSDAAAGIVVAESSSPNFLLNAIRNGAITSGALDMELQFLDPVARIDLAPGLVVQNGGPAVVPGDDTFYNALQWAPRAIEAPAAWALGYSGLGVRIAVIDGGVYDAHPDLVGNIDTYASRSFVDAGLPGYMGCLATAYNCDTGTFWHGTHVAGIIAARDNSTGVIGIAPQSRVVALKALHGGFGTFGSVVSAILYAATSARVNIINMSLGAVIDRYDPGARELMQALDDAIAYANSRGVLVVVSAGNDAINLDDFRSYVVVPASSPAVVAVSATGPQGFGVGATNFKHPASYSNYGRSLVWIAGPGGETDYQGTSGGADCGIAVAGVGTVTQPCWIFDMIISTTRTGYSWTAGTSMAAPAVAAVAALARQRNPRYTTAQLRSLLAATATDEGNPGFFGRGFVNARRAVTR